MSYNLNMNQPQSQIYHNHSQHQQQHFNNAVLNGINTMSYKLVTAPNLNTITRAKTFMYPQNGSNNNCNVLGNNRARFRGTSVDKTSF